MTLPLTPLERAILDWIAARVEDDALRRQCAQARALGRSHSGHGRFTRLAVPRELPATALSVRAPLDPYIASPELEAGGGCILFLREGYLDTLEIYAHGDAFPEEDPVDFSLHPAAGPH